MVGWPSFLVLLLLLLLLLISLSSRRTMMCVCVCGGVNYVYVCVYICVNDVCKRIEFSWREDLRYTRAIHYYYYFQRTPFYSNRQADCGALHSLFGGSVNIVTVSKERLNTAKTEIRALCRRTKANVKSSVLYRVLGKLQLHRKKSSTERSRNTSSGFVFGQMEPFRNRSSRKRITSSSRRDQTSS